MSWKCQTCSKPSDERMYECFLCRLWNCYDCMEGTLVMNTDGQLQPKHRCKDRKQCNLQAS